MEFLFAHLCFKDHHILPSEFSALPREDKAFIIASYEKALEDNKKLEQKYKNKGG